VPEAPSSAAEPSFQNGDKSHLLLTAQCTPPPLAGVVQIARKVVLVNIPDITNINLYQNNKQNYADGTVASSAVSVMNRAEYFLHPVKNFYEKRA
jgi:hypothetical protein